MTTTLQHAVSVTFAFLLGTSGAVAGSEDANVILKKLSAARSDLKVDSITRSVATGLYEVRLDGGAIIYATADGNHFVLGDLFAVGSQGFVNLAEQRRDADRLELIASVNTDDMIVFSPRGEAKALINVFTDVDCFYCQKLHQEVPALNALGIEVRYLAYPRSGIGGESYRKIASAWCSDDPNTAITRLKAREEIPENVCAGNPVADQFVLGQKVGVRGTPAMVLENGQLVQGYKPADQLAAQLGIN